MGKTHNIPERDSQYATSELKRGYFESVFEVENMGTLECLLQYEFHEFNVKYDAGIEFYTKNISTLIEPYLIKQEIPYLLQKSELRKHYLDISKVCEELCEMDALFLPNELWVEYYDVKDLRDIIIINPKKKKKSLVF